MHVIRDVFAIGALTFLALTVPAKAQPQRRWCNVPCSHPAHPFDVGPCTHACYTAWGPVPCHPSGDAYPCVHPMHPYDVIPCEH